MKLGVLMKKRSEPQLSVSRIYADGGCFPNPGERAIAVVDSAGNVWDSKKIGYGTNNEAEYEACIRALELAEEKGLTSFELCLDSMLVINQVQGKWKIDDKFWKYIQRIAHFQNILEEVTFIFVRSKDNLADAEVKRLLETSGVPMFRFGKRE